MAKVKVRVAVAVDSEGNWGADGADDMDKNMAIGCAMESMAFPS